MTTNLAGFVAALIAYRALAVPHVSTDVVAIRRADDAYQLLIRQRAQMPRFRAMLPEQYVTVEADTPFEAQNIAFAHMIRALNPEEISVTEARPGDLFWDEEASFEKQA